MNITLARTPNGRLCPKYANRHGLITGATGGGKTVTVMRLMAEFNRLGVPVFAPDAKGDIWGGLPKFANIDLRHLIPGQNFFMSIARLGGDLMARALELTDAQRGLIENALSAGVAPQSPRHLLTLVTIPPGARRSADVIVRSFARLDQTVFAAEGFDVARLLNGPRVSVLDARPLMDSASMYAAAITFMLRDLNNRLPEVGDLPLPKLVFVIDEAHLLFRECPADLLSDLEKIVRLIRSKGVSLWFVTQSPQDIPPIIREQLQNRVVHRGLVKDMPQGHLRPGEAFLSLVQPIGAALPIYAPPAMILTPEWRPPAFEQTNDNDDPPSRRPAEQEPHGMLAWFKRNVRWIAPTLILGCGAAWFIMQLGAVLALMIIVATIGAANTGKRRRVH